LEPSEEHPNPALEIYKNLNYSMTEEEREFFNYENMTREDVPILLSKNTDTLQDAFCLAIVVNNFSKS
jgi:hypothetical protein